MKRLQITVISLLFIAACTCITFYALSPSAIEDSQLPLNQTSVNRALTHIKNLAKNPHFLGSKHHQTTAAYLEKALIDLGLDVQTQKGTTLTQWGNLAPVHNILARIKGTGGDKALLIMAHYDSAPHSASLGAADDGAGIATILEGIRAFLSKKTRPKNDLIILFTDGEELGLNGASLFVNKHPWAKEVGLALNFEARGTSGPAYMLLETPYGNQQLVDEFAKANLTNPLTSSLLYSLYKLMPNDTDLTVLREFGKIPGFNFAFIDNHFFYHTNKDNYDNLDRSSLQHQIDYFDGMLAHFSNKKLAFTTEQENVFFSIPFGLITYPFSWIYPLLTLSTALFLFSLFIGIGRRSLSLPDIAKGFLLFVGILLCTGASTFFGWHCFTASYPSYQDILQGFPYNGHAYIIGFIFSALAICFLFYPKQSTPAAQYSFLVTPLFFWLIINWLLAAYLPGGTFIIIPVLGAILGLVIYCVFEVNHLPVQLLIGLPTIIILIPLLYLLPIGLGLQSLYVSALLLAMVFGLHVPIFGQWIGKFRWVMLCALVATSCFIYAHFQAGFTAKHPRPNSLVYLLDADKSTAYYATYDNTLDSWTQSVLGKAATSGKELNHNNLYSKYGSIFTWAAKAPLLDISSPDITITQDSVIGRFRHVKIMITPRRSVNRYDIFAAEKLPLYNLVANGVRKSGEKNAYYRRTGRKVLSYYVVNNEPLKLSFTIPSKAMLDMEVQESSLDLLTNSKFKLPPRFSWMMPKPFVVTDAIIIQKKIPARKSNSKRTIVHLQTPIQDSIPADISAPEKPVDSIP